MTPDEWNDECKYQSEIQTVGMYCILMRGGKIKLVKLTIHLSFSFVFFC